MFEVRAGNSTITTLASFNGTNGANPSAGLVEDASGNLFGTTYQGGASADGTVFEVRAGSDTITTLASFNGANGQDPHAGLVEDGGGNLFGTTTAGGASGDGTVFEVKAGSGTINTLASFNGVNGANPHAGLVEDGSGNLFGTTYQGGASADGTVFEVRAGSDTITTLVSFNGTNGAFPLAGLVEDRSGNLFGTTFEGGASGDGTVFEMRAGIGAITTLASFNGTNGAFPNGAFPNAGLVEDGSGNLFGTTPSGGTMDYGTVFELPVLIQTVNRASTSTTLVSSVNPSVSGQSVTFRATVTVNSPGSSAAANPTGAVTFYDNGISIGMGILSGTSPDTATLSTSALLVGTHPIRATYAGDANFAGSGGTTLASFNVTNGQGPRGTLVEDDSGNLFGTTFAGGASGDGAVFEVHAASGVITTLASFNVTNGANPDAGLVEDGSGNLFGATFYGGASGDGNVFEVRTGSDTITTLASFNVTNGQGPMGTLIEDRSGNLLGTTYYGGASGDGTVFEVRTAAAPSPPSFPSMAATEQTPTPV